MNRKLCSIYNIYLLFGNDTLCMCSICSSHVYTIHLLLLLFLFFLHRFIVVPFYTLNFQQKFTNIVVILNASKSTVSSDFSHSHGTMADRLRFVAHDTLESMAQCINSFDTLDSGISFFVAICDRVRRWCSSKNYNRALDLDE